MDIIFYNGKINTLDETESVYSAVGVTHGRITAVGSDDELQRFSGPKTETIDLKGTVMFPGFMEAHNHLTIYGYLLDSIDLSATKVSKMDDVLSLVKAEAEKTSSGTWIKGSRYAEYFLAENRHPTKNDLDQVSPEHPVVLFHTSFHACTLNSAALEKIGIISASQSPQGGIIEKDTDTGEPTGVLHDQAMLEVFNNLFYADLETMDARERVKLCSHATQNFSQLGLVSAADALVVPQTLNM
jgi:predicted amidohydrolase YtcJ